MPANWEPFEYGKVDDLGTKKKLHNGKKAKIEIANKFDDIELLALFGKKGPREDRQKMKRTQEKLKGWLKKLKDR